MQNPQLEGVDDSQEVRVGDPQAQHIPPVDAEGQKREDKVNGAEEENGRPRVGMGLVEAASEVEEERKEEEQDEGEEEIAGVILDVEEEG